MLRNFLYLDETVLNGYVSALEDGLRSKRIASNEVHSDRQGAVDARVLKGQRGSSESDTGTVESEDTPHARFERLIELAKAQPERSLWLEIVQLEDLTDAGTGALVDFECEIEVPAVSQLGELGQLADLMESMSSLGPLLGQTDADMPSRQEVQAFRGFSSLLKSDDLVVVGEDDSDWRIAGTLRRKHLRASTSELTEYVRIMGKVGKVIPAGQYKSLLGLPGMSLLPRDERRRLERQKPTDEDRDMYLAGPARMIDVLAVYR